MINDMSRILTNLRRLLVFWGEVPIRTCFLFICLVMYLCISMRRVHSRDSIQEQYRTDVYGLGGGRGLSWWTEDHIIKMLKTRLWCKDWAEETARDGPHVTPAALSTLQVRWSHSTVIRSKRRALASSLSWCCCSSHCDFLELLSKWLCTNCQNEQTAGLYSSNVFKKNLTWSLWIWTIHPSSLTISRWRIRPYWTRLLNCIKVQLVSIIINEDEKWWWRIIQLWLIEQGCLWSSVSVWWGEGGRAQSMFVFVCSWLARVKTVIRPARSPGYRADLWGSRKRKGGGCSARGGFHLAR